MAWNNVRNEPRREWTEQLVGFMFMVLYIIWGYFAISITRMIYLPPKGWWDDPGDLGIWVILMISPWLIIPMWYIIHEIGEGVCSFMKGFGFDPRPKRRY